MCAHGIWFFFSSRRRHTREWRDWSSDVCSSDLQHLGREHLPPQPLLDVGERQHLTIAPRHQLAVEQELAADLRHRLDDVRADRKSVVSGKSVDLGGRRIIKKNTPSISDAHYSVI